MDIRQSFKQFEFVKKLAVGNDDAIHTIIELKR